MDLLTLVDKKNVWIYFGVSVELSSAEIYAYKEKDTIKVA
jgi:hypothetical protein